MTTPHTMTKAECIRSGQHGLFIKTGVFHEHKTASYPVADRLSKADRKALRMRAHDA